MHRSSHLATVHAGEHHRAKGADVEEIGAHPVTSLGDGISAAFAFLVAFQLLFSTDADISLFMRLVEDGLFFHINIEGRRFSFNQADKVAYLAFSTKHLSPAHGRIRHRDAAGCRHPDRRWDCRRAHQNEDEVVAVVQAHLDSPWVDCMDLLGVLKKVLALVVVAEGKTALLGQAQVFRKVVEATHDFAEQPLEIDSAAAIGESFARWWFLRRSKVVKPPPACWKRRRNSVRGLSR